MKLEHVQLSNKNKLIMDFNARKENIWQFYDYPTNAMEERLKDLKKRTFNRSSLTKVLYQTNKAWDAPAKTLENIERLKNDDAVIVVGGQQAGLLTGPLYTINKIISLIQYARQQEEKLKVPVIPLFWIAGEDHDFAEINHIYMTKDDRLVKQPISQHVQEGAPVSTIEINEEHGRQWIQKIIKTLPETVHTKNIYNDVLRCLKQSKTYVDFFARFIFNLFSKNGVVLLDSADPKLRQLEKDHFKTLITEQEKITKQIYNTSIRLKNAGYNVSVDVAKDDAHLFYHLHNERILLKRESDGTWSGKQGEINLTTNELYTIAEKTPEKLSNNVVTRPMMQELLLPTLAFIGGPGEISYWALLKDSFHHLGLQMPPMVSRLSFTYIDRQTERLLNTYQLDVSTVVNEGLGEKKMNWIASYEDPPVEQLFAQFKQTVQQAHKPIKDIAYHMRSDIGQLADKNLYHLNRTIDHLKQRMERAVKEKYDIPLKDFNKIENFLFPNSGLQERTWNVIPLLNAHGKQFIFDLTKENCSFDLDHIVVYI